MGGTGGAIDVIISPKGGHGSNAVKELGGHFVCINTTFTGAESDDILAGNEKAKSPSDKKVVNTINIPEDYIPELNQEQSKKVTVNSFNLGGNDLGNEIAGNVIFIGLSFVFYLSSSHNYDQAFEIMFLYSLLYSLLAFWRFRTAYFKKGWVKVFASPNNIVDFDKVTEGAATK